MSAKEWFLKTALAYLGTPYIWGGDDPSGFDCSGYVVECLKSVGLLREGDDYTADGLWRLFEDKAVSEPEEGALLFMLNYSGTAVHVVICLDEHFQIGASGGSAGTVDETSAWQANAYVKIRPIRFNASRMRLVRLF